MTAKGSAVNPVIRGGRTNTVDVDPKTGTSCRNAHTVELLSHA